MKKYTTRGHRNFQVMLFFFPGRPAVSKACSAPYRIAPFHTAVRGVVFRGITRLGHSSVVLTALRVGSKETSSSP